MSDEITAPEDPVNHNISTVEGRMEGLLSSSSPYIKRARTGAKQQAASRGLLNSSIAAGAGEAAAIDAALPIAQQDASAENQFGLADLQAGHTQDTLRTEAELKSGLMGEEAGYTSTLASEKAGYATDLATLQAGFEKDILQTNYDFESQLKQMEFTSDEVKAIGSSVTLLGQTLSDKVAQIQTDTTLDTDAKTTIIEQLQDMYQSQLNSVAAIYGVPITWS